MDQSERPDRRRRRSPGPFGRGATAALVAAILVALPATASSTVMTYMGLEELVADSDRIVRGTVEKRRTFVDDERGDVFTHTTIEVAETYLGEERRTITVEQWGGTHDGTTHRIPGDASFETGEEVVLFLAENRGEGESPHYLVGLAQSKFRVRRDGDGPVVTRDLSELAIKPQQRERGLMEGIGRQSWALRSFEAELESLVYARQRGSGDSSNQ